MPRSDKKLDNKFNPFNRNDASNPAKIPPHNLEAEMSLLGAVLIDEEALTTVSDIVKPIDFMINDMQQFMGQW